MLTLLMTHLSAFSITESMIEHLKRSKKQNKNILINSNQCLKGHIMKSVFYLYCKYLLYLILVLIKVYHIYFIYVLLLG